MAEIIIPGKTAPTPLLSKMHVRVEAVGPQVKLHVGNSCMTMSYEAALQMSQWLRVRGKEAKRNAGDTSRHWSAIAILDGLKE